MWREITESTMTGRIWVNCGWCGKAYVKTLLICFKYTWGKETLVFFKIKPSAQKIRACSRISHSFTTKSKIQEESWKDPVTS